MAIQSNISYEDQAVVIGLDNIVVSLAIDEISTSLLNNELTIKLELWDRDISLESC